MELRLKRQLWWFIVAVILYMIFTKTNATIPEEEENNDTDPNRSKSVKKDLNKIIGNLSSEPLELFEGNSVQQLSEKPLVESESEKSPVKLNEAKKELENIDITYDDRHVDEPNRKRVFLRLDPDMPESFQTGFYFFLALSCAAIIFLVFKIYRLRLSRAERKYGVQGDRSTQELTPLPVSIEDANSDEDDQTLFEVNRPHTRIL